MLSGRVSDATAYVTHSDEASDYVPANRREHYSLLHHTNTRERPACSRTLVGHLRDARDMQRPSANVLLPVPEYPVSRDDQRDLISEPTVHGDRRGVYRRHHPQSAT